jgi:hypothetical protein
MTAGIVSSTCAASRPGLSSCGYDGAYKKGLDLEIKPSQKSAIRVQDHFGKMRWTPTNLSSLLKPGARCA